MVKYLKKDERKKQIRKAAIELIVKNGYQKTSIQEIINKIDYSKGGFYNCYSSKEELFIDILKEGMEYRYSQLKNYKIRDDKIDRKTFLIEALLDKMLDYNEYKKIFSYLIIEMESNTKLYDIFLKNTSHMENQFIEFCKREGFEEYVKIVNSEFRVFINSIIIGTHSFNTYNNNEYRVLLRDMLSAYFERINLFE